MLRCFADQSVLRPLTPFSGTVEVYFIGFLDDLLRQRGALQGKTPHNDAKCRRACRTRTFPRFLMPSPCRSAPPPCLSVRTPLRRSGSRGNKDGGRPAGQVLTHSDAHGRRLDVSEDEAARHLPSPTRVRSPPRPRDLVDGRRGHGRLPPVRP